MLIQLDLENKVLYVQNQMTIKEIEDVLRTLNLDSAIWKIDKYVIPYYYPITFWTSTTNCSNFTTSE